VFSNSLRPLGRVGILVLVVAVLALAACAPATPGEVPGLTATLETGVTEAATVETTVDLETAAVPTSAATVEGNETEAAGTEEALPTAEVTESPEAAATAEETEALPGTGPNTVEVSLTEYEIDMPSSIPSGPATFRITNDGTEEHGFEIEGQDVEEALEPHLQPGDSGELEVDLAPGTYEIYCPVDGHADEGMRLELTVTEAGAEAGTPVATTEATVGTETGATATPEAGTSGTAEPTSTY
jgi:uncharacterized cupredoxin-like copper-binding protein